MAESSILRARKECRCQMVEKHQKVQIAMSKLKLYKAV